ncbi:hypothetical protein L6232_23595, partial [Shewanella sp. C31]|nr:hypothetical protein [Shewanella electrica]
MAEDEGLAPLLRGLLYEPGRPGGKARHLLDLRGFLREEAGEVAEEPFRVEGGRLVLAEDPWPHLD